MSSKITHGGIPVQAQKTDIPKENSPFAALNNPTLEKAKKIRDALKKANQ